MMAFQAMICGMVRTASMKPILSRKHAKGNGGNGADDDQHGERPRRHAAAPDRCRLAVRFTQSRQK
jgi:hypothetical protein